MTQANTRMIAAAFAVASILAVTSIADAVVSPEAKNRAEEVKSKAEAKKAEIADKRQEQFCARFAEGAERMMQKMQERYQHTNELRTGRVEDMEGRRSDRDDSFDEARKTRDRQRDSWYETLADKADTPDEETAVAEFEATIEEAVQVRRAAVDAAIKAFREGVDAAIASKSSGSTNGAKVFADEYEEVVDAAKSSCASGAEPEQVRAQFRADMESARLGLVKSRESLEKVGEQVRELAEVRRQSIADAIETFRATADAARAELRAAFGEAVTESAE